MLTRSSSHKPLVVADEAIPFLKGILEPWFEVRYLGGGAICADDLKQAEVLLTRTRTLCNEMLLSGSAVKLVATATIGTDHIDFEFCRKNGIAVVSAPGCNAGGVCQYVFSALRALGIKGGTLGVVGVGHVGSLVAQKGQEMGFDVLRNDIVGGEGFVSLDTLLEKSDIVTIHIPLRSVPGTLPEYDNHSFVSSGFFEKMKEKATFINASRGEVLDDEAFLAARSRLGKVVLDVWRNEADIDRRMLSAADIATPHIAGYSIQGKINGTQAVVRAVGELYRIPELSHYKVSAPMPPKVPYDIMADDQALREDPSRFEYIRSHYNYRDDSLC